MKNSVASWIVLLARLGYAAKGIVYVTVGLLATLTVFNMGGETTSSSGALQAIAQQPFGQILLGIVVVGLTGYVLWRFIQAIKDPEHRRSDDAKGVFRRLGYAINGLVYGGIALTALQLLMGTGGDQGSNDSTQVWTAKVMSQPFGPWMVGTGGAFMIGLGFYYCYRAFATKFREKLKLYEMSRTEELWATRVGVLGILARAVVFIIIGSFLIQAAHQADPSKARSSEGVLQVLQQNQPFGSVLLAFIAIGLFAYGLHMLVQARYRRIEPT
ncbi:DUF1206 domain-containing protein [Acaryochloris sp. CCMEE 5410]|uniref:DUF1206 domain-containing protein n=1 Tax=Acaryochloris sp. CCMEE 5410 TaxID=310037 RepID=UPI0002484EC6|nr:DUF1206 domain-containing protein [Acaryochloris sp. CCMEE 5410]KAI9132284.1 DUF1206 domain-containing protein [Acaryochloris sp. CCMEE 5410]